MLLGRRKFIVGIAALIAEAPAVASQETRILPLPDPQRFESGDFVWPKKPGTYVPYRSVVISSFEQDSRRWNAERDAFLQRRQVNRGYFAPSDILAIRDLRYREFHARYAGDQKPNVPGVYSSGGGTYVGHVGIIDLTEDGPRIIEAVGEKVRSVKYQEWINERPGEIVWHGRIGELSKDQRQKISATAVKHVGRPYDFWNFDLNDDAGFYCSKLVWLSVWRSLGFAVDGNDNNRRTFWFSPKQLLYTSRMVRLHDPGSYANL